MQDKHVLGVKSKKYITLMWMCAIPYGIVFLLSVAILLTRFSWPFLLCFILFGLVSIHLAYEMIKTLLSPEIMVECDSLGVYLHFRKNRTEYIPFCDIEEVFADHFQTKAKRFPFGFLKIRTKGNSYKVGMIDSVKQAEELIYSKIAYKYHC